MCDKIIDVRQEQRYRYTYAASYESIAKVEQGRQVRIET